VGGRAPGDGSVGAEKGSGILGRAARATRRKWKLRKMITGGEEA
jgi:hypothetical protein